MAANDYAQRTKGEFHDARLDRHGLAMVSPGVSFNLDKFQANQCLTFLFRRRSLLGDYILTIRDGAAGLIKIVLWSLQHFCSLATSFNNSDAVR